MVSKPNFVLGIKQKSLASKEDSHVHITSRSHTYLSAGSRLHNISQPPWLYTVSKSNNQAICASPYPICAHQAFACRNWPHRCAPRPPTRKTQKSSQPKPNHAPPRVAVSSGISPTCHIGILTGRSSLVTRAALLASLSTDLQNLRFYPSFNLTRATKHLSSFGLLLHSLANIARSCHAPKHCYWCHLTSPDDVITPRQQPRKHVHVNLSPRQRHVIRMSQRLCSLICEWPGKLKIDPDHVSVDFDPGQVNFDQKSKFS